MKTYHARVFLQIEMDGWIKARTQTNALKMFNDAVTRMSIDFENAEFGNAIINYKWNFKDDESWHHHIVEDDDNEN